MLEVFAVVLAAFALVGCAVLAVRVSLLERRLASALRLLEEKGTEDPPALPLNDKPNALEGLRIALAVAQDHPHAPFTALLKEELFAEDVTDIATLTPEEARTLRAEWKPDGTPDILIEGKIVCNGYSEIFYEADITCFTASDTVCTVVQRPPHGDRPPNLAIELISTLKAELSKQVDRGERRRALRELRAP